MRKQEKKAVGMTVQQLLTQLFSNRWYDYLIATGTILYSHWHQFSAASGKVVQQLLARFFITHRHDSSTVTGIILQQSLGWLFNSRWHNSSTVTDTIVWWLLAQLHKNRVNVFLYLFWQKSSTVMFTVEELCHVPEYSNLETNEIISIK